MIEARNLTKIYKTPASQVAVFEDLMGLAVPDLVIEVDTLCPSGAAPKDEPAAHRKDHRAHENPLSPRLWFEYDRQFHCRGRVRAHS